MHKIVYVYCRNISFNIQCEFFSTLTNVIFFIIYSSHGSNFAISTSLRKTIGHFSISYGQHHCSLAFLLLNRQTSIWLCCGLFSHLEKINLHNTACCDKQLLCFNVLFTCATRPSITRSLLSKCFLCIFIIL